MSMSEFGIEPNMTGSKMLFAGIRFFISGLIILAIAKGTLRLLLFRTLALMTSQTFTSYPQLNLCD